MAEPGDAGFICKSCAPFFADAEVVEWSTDWDPSGETLLQITHTCPLCGAVASYRIEESTLRGAAFKSEPQE